MIVGQGVCSPGLASSVSSVGTLFCGSFFPGRFPMIWHAIELRPVRAIRCRLIIKMLSRLLKPESHQKELRIWYNLRVTNRERFQSSWSIDRPGDSRSRLWSLSQQRFSHLSRVWSRCAILASWRTTAIVEVCSRPYTLWLVYSEGPKTSLASFVLSPSE